MGEEESKESPLPRTGHSIVHHGNALYVFGGQNDFNDKMNDLWKFDLASRTWSAMPAPEESIQPTARSGHTAVLLGGRMVVFGGIVEVTKEINEMHIFDFASGTWSVVDDENTVSQDARQHLVPKETLGASMSVQHLPKGTEVSKGKVRLGPAVDEPETKNLKKAESHAVFAKSRRDEKPYGRPGQNKSPVKQVEVKKMEEVRKGLNTPTSESMKNAFIVANADPSFDAYYHTLKRKKDRSHKDHAAKGTGPWHFLCQRPTARDGHSMSVYEGRVFIFGGDRHHMPFNDLYSLKL